MVCAIFRRAAPPAAERVDRWASSARKERGRDVAVDSGSRHRHQQGCPARSRRPNDRRDQRRSQHGRDPAADSAGATRTAAEPTATVSRAGAFSRSTFPTGATGPTETRVAPTGPARYRGSSGAYQRVLARWITWPADNRVTCDSPPLGEWVVDVNGDALPKPHRAGRQLARLLHEQDLPDPVVVGLPRGGVPVAAEVASALRAPLEVIVARKLGAPRRPELAIGAITEDGGLVIDRSAVEFLRLADDIAVLVAADKWQQELERRVRLYRCEQGFAGRDVVLVDDGLATGYCRLRALGEQRPRTLVLAVPAFAASTADRLHGEADEVLCGLTSPDFTAVDLTAVGCRHGEFA